MLESLTPIASQSGERQVRGVLSGRIIEMPFSDGQDFNKGDVLVRFDCSVSEQCAQQDLATMFKEQEPLSGPLTLYEAIARAVKYSLEARLRVMEEAMAQRQVDLATLINLPLGPQVELAPDAGYQMPELKVELDTLEQEALASRPELREQDYQARISAAETRKAMLRLLPGLEFSAGGHYDSNSFLVNQSWADYGVKVTWNLFNVLSAPAAIDVAKAGQEVAGARRQAMSMAILAQLHVANANFREAQRQFQTSQQLAGLDGQIVEQLRNRYQAQGIGELELIQGELNTLQADLRRDLAYAELRNSYGQLFASVGLDPLPESVASDSVADIAAALSTREAQWQAGQL